MYVIPDLPTLPYLQCPINRIHGRHREDAFARDEVGMFAATGPSSCLKFRTIACARYFLAVVLHISASERPCEPHFNVIRRSQRCCPKRGESRRVRISTL